MGCLNLWIACFLCVTIFADGTNRTFIPTDSWKTIEEGEAIPAGLHVRINLQTGKKEAKLMSDDTKEAKSSSLIEVKEEESNNLDPDKLKKLLKNIKNDDGNLDGSSDTKFRSYEEIKKDFDSLKLNIKTDLEIINKKFDEFRSIINTSVENNSIELVAVLSDLEFLVHQYDNAIEFARLGGFSNVIVHCLNVSKDYEVRAETLKLMGSAVQSNPQVQKMAFDAGCVNVLLKLLALEQNPLLRSRSIYAISCLLRNFPPAQLDFVQNGGISVLSKIFDDKKDASEKTRLKIINLLTDLLVEIKSIERYQHTKLKEYQDLTGLETSLREQGWCIRAADWFCKLEDWPQRSSTLSADDLDHSMIDSTIEFLQPLCDTCLADFVINLDLLSSVNHAKELYADLSLRDLDEGVTDSLHLDILHKLRELAGTLVRTSQYRDEL